jgi:hypothetical protein
MRSRFADTDVSIRFLKLRPAKQALEHSRDFQGPIRLLLTDIMTPPHERPEPAGEVSSLRPGIKEIFTSGYTNDAIARQGVLDPAAAVIQNPIVLKRACAYSHRLGL